MEKKFQSSLFRVNADKSLTYVGTDDTDECVSVAEKQNGTYLILDTMIISEIEEPAAAEAPAAGSEPAL